MHLIVQIRPLRDWNDLAEIAEAAEIESSNQTVAGLKRRGLASCGAAGISSNQTVAGLKRDSRHACRNHSSRSNQTVAGLKPEIDCRWRLSRACSNQTVAGLKHGLAWRRGYRNEVQIRPLRDWNRYAVSVLCAISRFKSDRCGIETHSPETSSECIIKFKSDRCGIETDNALCGRLYAAERSNQTVAGLKLGLWYVKNCHRFKFKSDRCGIETSIRVFKQIL